MKMRHTFLPRCRAMIPPGCRSCSDLRAWAGMPVPHLLQRHPKSSPPIVQCSKGLSTGDRNHRDGEEVGT
jgi:hypothetical protein